MGEEVDAEVVVTIMMIIHQEEMIMIMGVDPLIAILEMAQDMMIMEEEVILTIMVLQMEAGVRLLMIHMEIITAIEAMVELTQLPAHDHDHDHDLLDMHPMVAVLMDTDLLQENAALHDIHLPLEVQLL